MTNQRSSLPSGRWFYAVVGCFLIVTVLAAVSVRSVLKKQPEESPSAASRELYSALERPSERPALHHAEHELSFRLRGYYPWESFRYFPITKQDFRCRGMRIAPPRRVMRGGQELALMDCDGEHSLPLRGGEEWVAPRLLELLNWLQRQLHGRVVVTSGHCCPDHQLLLDGHGGGESSRHQIGAAVDFYVEGFDSHPEVVIALFQQFWEEPAAGQRAQTLLMPKVGGHPPTWSNREVSITLYRVGEGRSLDNSHSHPYFCLQLLYDIAANQRVVYRWHEAQKGFCRTRSIR